MIDHDYLLARLLDLVKTPSPVGMTERAVALVDRWLRELGYAPKYTRRGVLYIKVGDGTPRRALAAHLDTLGAMVTELKPNGRLALRNTGTWAARFAEGARVTIFSDAGEHRGTILPLKASGHRFNTDVDTQPADWDNLEIRVDAVLPGHDALVAAGFNVGDMVAIDAQPEVIDGFIVSRHLDDKAGCATLLAVLKAIAEGTVEVAVPFQAMFTIAEEIGIGGTHGFGSEVEELLAIDNAVTAPNQSSRDDAVTIAMRDRQGPFDARMTRHMLDICAREGIAHVRDTFRHYRSDSAAAVEAGWDIRVGLVCFSLDSSHGWERTHMASLVALGQLIAAYIASPLEPVAD
ncbi:MULTISPECIES: osmoprotectant NAGGN system M42 family peptidase [Devosia]|uniref:Glutamyl aminopeptidase n=1 Tax=Devosia equisanguinis TaxID=2490941 RepID=A0A447I8N7_9HYPH|nr:MULTISPECIES: osmoprotectant NAGGN system M42 family peptidase [Devosia]ODT47745.1 MAG: peptidase M42 [Pelagibacterium sp. SCN 63-126]ODU88199.1 MAG: peptidase M42 [Pelagibacterium sp. SCN 63-17]OJX42547.1 MAG: peptidase M42 [Devosia sp. 63-57]VDS03901.1 Glutamyl aminopeptidase [Devosia equisanguinis]